MNAEKLTKYYHTLTEDLKRFSRRTNTVEELSRMIYSSECLRIFLIGNIKAQKISIEVEMSLPFSLIYGADNDSNYNKEIEKCANLRKIIEQQISNLRYLMNLNDNGFSLGVIKEEGCLWIAEKTLETEPTDSFCKVIIPSILH